MTIIIPNINPCLPCVLPPINESPLNKKIRNIFGESFSKEITLLNNPLASGLPEEKNFSQYRSTADPDLTYKELNVETSSMHNRNDQEVKEVQEACIKQYTEANQAFEQSIGDAVLSYVYPNGDKEQVGKGPLLELSNKLSQRYLDLYRAYVKYEIKNNIPMISNAAGQMKNQGFETMEIIAMKKDCGKVLEGLDTIKEQILKNSAYLKENKNKNSKLKPTPQLNEEGKEIYNEVRAILFSRKARENFLQNKAIKGLENHLVLSNLIEKSIKEYSTLAQADQIDRACFMLSSFGKMNVDEIEFQLYEVANLQTKASAKEDERLLMEMRHRVGGEGAVSQTSPGSMGQNPLSYLNVIRTGEANNPEGEFREQMYFVYMSNNFTNTMMKDTQLIHYANAMLEEEKKDWKIDLHFVEEMNARSPNDLPPLFRYGSQASLNKYLRSPIKKEEKETYLKEHPNPRLKEVMEPTEQQNLDANFRYRLTQRELLNQFGVRNWKEADSNQPLKFASGGSVFHLNDLSELPTSSNDLKLKFAKEYLHMVKELKIPTAAGISGTLDQSTTMAGLVGIGIGLDKEKELEQIKLAYLAFMVPNTDHSVHEIMQSTKSFGLEYVPGPGFEKYIYPSMGDEFIHSLKKEQAKRQYELPSYYISLENVKKVAENILTRKENLEIKIKQRLAKTFPSF